MANAPGFLSKDHIERVKQLKGRAHVTYPYAETAHRRTERYENPIRSAAWQKTFGAADPEYPEAKLVEQVKLYEDDQFAYCYFRYEELTGLPLKTWELYKGEAYKVTERQRVPAGTKPDRSGAATLSHTITEINALLADSVKVYLADLNGIQLATGAIVVTEQIDAQTGVPIYTDLYLAPASTTLPTIFVGGDPLTVIDVIGQWFQPNANKIGYSAGGYSPLHLPIEARKINIEGSAMVWIEVEHCRKPTSRPWDEGSRKRWPKTFLISDPFLVSEDYTGKYQPPWPIGAENLDGYTPDSHAYGGYQRTVEHYTRGRNEGLPPIFQITSPGTASLAFGRFIDEETIHGPINFYEAVSSGGSTITYQTEAIPSSTPSEYNPSGIYVLDAKCEPWRGEWWKTTIVQGSEKLTPVDFPDPALDGYYTALRNFTVTPDVVLNARLGNKKLYVQTVAAGGGVGTETVRVKAWGKQAAGDGPLSTNEIVTARPTVSSASTLSQKFINILCATLEQPTVSDSVVIHEQVTPSHGALTVNGTPADGDVMVLALTGSPLRYQYRTALTSDSLTGLTLTAGGSNYRVAPGLIFARIFPTVDPATDTFSATAHGLTNGTLIEFATTGAVPPPLTAGVGYYVVSTATDTFKVSLTSGGAAIDITSDKIGTLAVFLHLHRNTAYASTTINALGAVSRLEVEYPGMGYDDSHLPTAMFTDGGTGAAATATVSGSGVTGFIMTTAGTRYSSVPTVTVAPSSTGATAKATATLNATGGVGSVALRTATFLPAAVNTGSEVITIATHGLANEDGISFSNSGGALPAGLSAGTIYYVTVLTSSTFTVSTSSPAGSAVNLTGAGTGTHSITYCGVGYGSAPHVAFTGGAGSGASATVEISQKRQIKISSTKAAMAARIYQAVRGEGIGINVGRGTTANPDVTAAQEKSDLRTVHFFSLDPIVVHDTAEWDFGLTTGIPFVDQTAATWCTLSAFTAGEEGEILCTIPAGQTGAFFAGVMSFATNNHLVDAAPDNDAKAKPGLPGLVTLYSDWMPIPPGKVLTLIYAATGPAMKMAYQLNSGTTAPADLATTAVTITATNGSKVISALDSSHVGKAILVEGDTQPNEITSTTGLFRPYGGTTGSHSATIINCVAHHLPVAGTATLREVEIGNPGTSFLRLKVQQSIERTYPDRLAPLRCAAMYAAVAWKVTPDDDAA